MKKLLYKEFILAVHPICYVFLFVFPLLMLIPSYPLFVGTIYIIPIFSFLFLGAKKGVQSNDLFYTALLPIRKKEIVKARMLTITVMETITLSLMGILSPIKILVDNNMDQSHNPFSDEGIVSGFAFVIIGYAIVNAFYFLMFYKKGRSILAPTLISVIFYAIYMMLFTTILPAVDVEQGGVPLAPGFYNAFVAIDAKYQLIYLFVGILIFFVSNYVIYRLASKRLENADL